jgi:hypothetical protein
MHNFKLLQLPSLGDLCWSDAVTPSAFAVLGLMVG